MARQCEFLFWKCVIYERELMMGYYRTSIEAHPSGSNLLVTQEGGLSHLVTFRATENKGSIEKTYTSERLQVLASNKNSAERRLSAVFATRGQAVLFGVVNSCTLIWDRKKGVIVYGLKHEEGM